MNNSMPDPDNIARPRVLVDTSPPSPVLRASYWVPLFGFVLVLAWLAHAMAPYLARPTTPRESTMNLRKIFDTSWTYFATYQGFPESQSLTPFEPVGEWPMPSEHFRESPTWQALDFGGSDRFFYQYQYDSTNHPTDPAQSTFTASAFGDLDGDGILSTFVRFGTVRNMRVEMAGELFIVNELE